MHKIRREKRTTISKVIVRGKREILSKLNKIRIGFISIFLLKARVSYLTILKRKNLKGPGQPPPFSMPSKLWILHGEAKSEFFTIGCTPESMSNYL